MCNRVQGCKCVHPTWELDESIRQKLKEFEIEFMSINFWLSLSLNMFLIVHELVNGLVKIFLFVFSKIYIIIIILI